MNRICAVCNEYNAGEVRTIIIKDGKETVEFSCHSSCSFELQAKVKAIKGLEKMPVKKVLQEIGFDGR